MYKERRLQDDILIFPLQVVSPNNVFEVSLGAMVSVLYLHTVCIYKSPTASPPMAIAIIASRTPHDGVCVGWAVCGWQHSSM